MADASRQTPEMRRNERLGIINGVCFAVSEAVSHPSLVLALLIRKLGGSLTLVGSLPVIQTVGYLLPQLLAAGYLRGQSHRLPLYRLTGILRIVMLALLTLVIGFTPLLPAGIAPWLVIACFAAYMFLGGITALAFQEVIAKVIPVERRGRFFGRRQLLGGMLAFLVGALVVRRLLGDQSPLAFPLNFAALSAASTVCFAGCIIAFSRISEPPSPAVGAAMSPLAVIRSAPALLRGTPEYRWFIGARLLTNAGRIAEPFYVIFATEQLGLSDGVAGLFIALWAVSGSLSNLVWGRLTDRRGNRPLILASAALMVVAPSAMLILALLGAPPFTAIVVGLILVFLCTGAAVDGSNIASVTYLMETAPEGNRSLYLGVSNTLLGIGAFIPLVGGWLVGRIGFAGVFATGMCLALCGLAAATRVRAVRQAPAAVAT